MTKRAARIAAARNNHKHDWAIKDNTRHYCTVCGRTVRTSVLSNLNRAQHVARVLNAKREQEIS